ncbi:hypothetical protein EDB92DRAFT_1148692 [Lactarius akahatsu]|uniref:Uncharacterized protein n=1 Tax=Lactarius akahatsu TaxID=416441 RepID=A0AAD4L265_9AGAM|nr:hypothetical protein EDB92DRAFT_1148692 [Lactarius akahatsu]
MVCVRHVYFRMVLALFEQRRQSVITRTRKVRGKGERSDDMTSLPGGVNVIDVIPQNLHGTVTPRAMMPSFIWKYRVRVPLLRLSSRRNHLSVLLLHPNNLVPTSPMSQSNGNAYHCSLLAPPTSASELPCTSTRMPATQYQFEPFCLIMNSKPSTVQAPIAFRIPGRRVSLMTKSRSGYLRLLFGTGTCACPTFASAFHPFSVCHRVTHRSTLRTVNRQQPAHLRLPSPFPSPCRLIGCVMIRD